MPPICSTLSNTTSSSQSSRISRTICVWPDSSPLRKKLWRKGEESGHTQLVHEIRLDCDEDVVLLSVEQIGGIACHTGRHNCFFQKLENGEWVTVDPVIKDPSGIYDK